MVVSPLPGTSAPAMKPRTLVKLVLMTLIFDITGTSSAVLITP